MKLLLTCLLMCSAGFAGTGMISAVQLDEAALRRPLIVRYSSQRLPIVRLAFIPLAKETHSGLHIRCGSPWRYRGNEKRFFAPKKPEIVISPLLQLEPRHRHYLTQPSGRDCY